MNRSGNKIDDILESLSGMQRAEAKPFMYTRVMARLQQNDSTAWGRLVSFLAKPAVAIACVVAIIATNLYFVRQTENTQDEVSTVSSTSAVEDYLSNENFILAVNNIDNR